MMLTTVRTRLLTPSLTHSLTHSPTLRSLHLPCTSPAPPTHSLTPPHTHSHTRPLHTTLRHPPTHSFTHSLPPSHLHLHLNPPSPPLPHSLTHTQTRLLRTTRKYPGIHDRKHKRLDVVLLGHPNAGKSVLLNELLTTKLAATSRKRQTTRTKILGVFNYHKTQLAFYDIPGFVPSHSDGKEEVRRLRSLITSTVALADVVVLVIDAAKACNHVDVHDYAEMIRLAFDGASQEVILVLNKVDLVHPKNKLLDLTYDIVSIINGVKLGPEGADKAMLDTTTFMISAMENDGVIDLKNYLLAAAKPKEWVIPANSRNTLTTLPDEERVEEVIREMLLDSTHEEIPYVAGVTCQTIRSMSPTKLRVDVDIFVDNSRQQRIIVGDKGRTMVKIRQTGVEVLENIFKKTVILYIWVKVRSKRAEENEEEQLL